MSRSLLIIGAGGHGQVVAEVAVDCGYSEIAFIDDTSDRAIGKISEIEKFKEKYTDLFIGIGNNRLREQLFEWAEEMGFCIPILVHPTAYISRTAVIEKGIIVEPMAIVNARSVIRKGTIVSIGAVIDHDVEIGKYSHINAGAIIKAGTEIDDYTKIDAGEVGGNGR